MRQLRVLMAGVPALFYFALVFTLLAWWAGDVRGMYIAGACALGGVIQLVRGQN